MGDARSADVPGAGAGTDSEAAPASGGPPSQPGPGETNGLGLPDRFLEPLVEAAARGISSMRPVEVPPRLAPLRGGRPRRLRPVDRAEITRSLGRHEKFTEKVLDLFYEENSGDVDRFADRTPEDILEGAGGDLAEVALAACALLSAGRPEEAAQLSALAGGGLAAAEGGDHAGAVRENRILRLRIDELTGALQREQRKSKLRTRQLGLARETTDEIAAMRAAADAERAAAEGRMEAARQEAGALRRRIVELEEAAESWRRERSDMRSELEDLAARYRRARRDLKEARAKIPPAAVPPAQLPASQRPPDLAELKEALATRGEAGVLSMKRLFVIVDGYNVGIGLVGGGTLEEKRRRLEQALQRYESRSGNRVMVVYDGKRVEWFWVPRVGGHSIFRVFTPDGQIADDYIVAELEAGIDHLAPVVVTSDFELDQRCRALGALVLASEPVARYLNP